LALLPSPPLPYSIATSHPLQTPTLYFKTKHMNETTTLQQSAVNPNKALWEKGDFTQIAETMRESGSALIEKLSINKGMQVLDLGCGDGTTAIASARLGAHVLTY
jgi:cyclopropane fatty-acyl-phospholipid synthase-like methyltransferase